MKHYLSHLLLPILGALCLSTGPALAAPFTLDGAHSAIYFAASHFERSLVRGRFLHLSGQVDFDANSHTGGIDLRIDPDSIDTGLGTLDNVLKSAQFFDTKEFQFIRFQSTRFVFDGARLQAVDGVLTMHGVSTPVQLLAKRFSCGEQRVGVIRRQVCGGDFHTSILRSAFGMTRFLPDVSDRVDIDIAVEATPGK